MNDLKSVIKALSNKEVKFIIDFYKNNDKQLRLILFKGIRSDKFKTDEAACLKIYGKKNTAFSHLKKRLKKDLLNLLLFYEEDTKSLSPVIKAETEVDRLLIQAKILYRKKANTYAAKLLKEAYTICVKFDLKEKTIVTYWYGIIGGNLNGLNFFNDITKNLIEDSNSLTNYFDSYIERFRVNLYLKKSLVYSNTDYIYIAYINIKKIYNNTNSSKIKSNYFIVAIQYFEQIKNYKEVYKLALELNELILNNIELRSVIVEVNSYLRLFSATINLKKYTEATKFATKSHQIIAKSRLKGSNNELLVLGYIFLANLREKDTSELKKCLNNGLSHPRLNSTFNNTEKWLFFQSFYFFKLEKYDDALSSMYKTNHLLKDKSGWLFTFKLIEIMCYIEKEEFDMVHFRIDTFRKLLSKQNNVNKIRIKTIYSILKCLLKNGFQFSKVYKLEKPKLVLLKEGKDSYYWDPLGFETIRFDEWFEKHIYSTI